MRIGPVRECLGCAQSEPYAPVAGAGEAMLADIAWRRGHPNCGFWCSGEEAMLADIAWRRGHPNCGFWCSGEASAMCTEENRAAAAVHTERKKAISEEGAAPGIEIGSVAAGWQESCSDCVEAERNQQGAAAEGIQFE